MARCLAGLGRIETGQGELELARRASRREHRAQPVDRQQDRRDQGTGLVRRAGDRAREAPAWPCGWPRRLPPCAGQASLPEAPASRTERLLTAAAGLGETVVNGALGRGVGARAATPRWRSRLALPMPRRREPADLTAREVEIAVLITRGLSNKAIADELGISIGDCRPPRRQHHGQARVHVPGADRQLGPGARLLIVEQCADRFSLVNPPDRLGQCRGDRDDVQFLVSLRLGNRH